MIGHAGEILVLTGPPGAGKTTAAKPLASMPGSPKVHLHSDDFWHCIKHGAIQPWLAQAHQQNGVVMDVLAAAAAAYARGGYFVVLDGVIGPWFIDRFRDLNVPMHYVILRPPLDVAVERCRRRSGEGLNDAEPVAALHAQFSGLGDFERYVVSTQGCGRDETLTRVLALLEDGSHRLTS